MMNYLDKSNKIYALPKKKIKRMMVYDYLIDKFDKDKLYTEKEINAIINENHSFNNVCLIRRELVDYQYISRSDNGSEYRRAK